MRVPFLAALVAAYACLVPAFAASVAGDRAESGATAPFAVTPPAQIQAVNGSQASITLSSVENHSIYAEIDPAAADVGKVQNIWMGAYYKGMWFLRDGMDWRALTGDEMPVAIRSVPMSSRNIEPVVDNMDLSNMFGLQLFVGFGKNAEEMLTTPGKLANIFSVPVPALTNIQLVSADLGVGDKTQIVPVPYGAELGACSSTNSQVASVSGDTVTAVGVGNAAISCGSHVVGVVVSLPCMRTVPGTYTGTISGGYTGTVSIVLGSGDLNHYAIQSATVNVNGLSRVNVSGWVEPPQVYITGMCPWGNTTISCISADGNYSHGVITGKYTTSDQKAGTFSLTKVCS